MLAAWACNICFLYISDEGRHQTVSANDNNILPEHTLKFTHNSHELAHSSGNAFYFRHAFVDVSTYLPTMHNIRVPPLYMTDNYSRESQRG